ncbi:acetate--CoA ligase family protein [Anaeromyxobacter oryzisoli]|uniref:acetate--CoA ligase family protein n=1 Tax=Anaeromyxobacter oryzisoli TaxID=2925408 RepID=UPI0027E1D1B4|nr:acetate--CoA ligase family protein [Anaeromyxobacter sp. SG63]
MIESPAAAPSRGRSPAPPDSRLFTPRRVAVVGASESRDTFQGKAIRYLVERGFRGEVYPVNPRYERVLGRRCHRSVRELPEPIDAAVVAVRADRVLDVLADSAAQGCRLAVVVSTITGGAGGGPSWRREVADLVARTGMRVVGPNCVGVVNFVHGITLGTSTISERDELLRGSIGLVSQSGALLGSILDQAQDEGCGFSYAISAGDEADLTLAEYLRFLADDPDTSVILAYVEGIRDYDGLIAAAEVARRSGKPIFACKLGRSRKGVEVAATHTGALAGTDRAVDALFREAGIVRVDTPEDLFRAAALYQRTGPLKSTGVAIFSASGGAAGLLADRCELHGLDLPPPTAAVSARLRERTGIELPHNPFDILRRPVANLSRVSDALRDLAADERFGVTVVGMTMVYFLDHVADMVLDAVAASVGRVVVCWPAGSVMREQVDRLRAAGVPVFDDADACLRAVRAVQSASRPLRALTALTFDAPVRRVASETGWLLEHEAKELLAEHGIPVTREAEAASAEEAVQAARRLGYPVALKILSEDVPHKSDVGGVLLRIDGDAQVRDGFRTIVRDVSLRMKGARIRGALVQEMAEGGAEVLLGTKDEPGLGPILVFGLGGVYAEIFDDVAVRPARFLTRAMVHEMIRETKAHVLLSGTRGRPPLDVDAIVDTAMDLARLALSHRDSIDQIDVNPLMVFERGRGVMAVDALVRLHGSPPSTASA